MMMMVRDFAGVLMTVEAVVVVVLEVENMTLRPRMD